MKNLKIYLTLLLFMTAGIVMQAQSDPKADKIVKTSRNKFKALDTYIADFSYTLENPNIEKPIVKKGTLKMKKEKYQVKLSDQNVYCDGKTVWVHNKLDEEVITTPYDPQEGLSVEKVYQVYEEDTKSRYDGMEGKNHKISVFWIPEDSEYWKAEMWIDSDNYLIQQAIMYSRNGSKHIYKLTNNQMNMPVNDTEFKMTKEMCPDCFWD